VSAGGPGADWLTDDRTITEAEALQLRNNLKKTLMEEDYVGLDAARIGNADRDKYVEHLGNMYTQGYLDDEEFKVRSDKASAAVHYGDLRHVLDELPPLPSDTPTAIAGSRLEPAQDSEAFDIFMSFVAVPMAILLALNGLAFIIYLLVV
jgi:hypothetical protein